MTGSSNSPPLNEWASLMAEWEKAEADFRKLSDPSIPDTPQARAAAGEAEHHLEELKQRIDAVIAKAARSRAPKRDRLVVAALDIGQSTGRRKNSNSN